MQRRKRHLRLKTIIFDFDGFRQQFYFNLKEDLVGSSSERDEKIKNIKVMIEAKKMQNLSFDNTQLSNTNIVSQGNINSFIPPTNIVQNTQNELIYDLSTYDSNNSFANDSSSNISEKKEDDPHTEEINDQELLSIDENDTLDENVGLDSFSLINEYQYFMDDNSDDQVNNFQDNENSDYLKYYLF